MARETLTDDQVEREIERLQNSPYVKLAQTERRLRNKRRMYLYHLRQEEKRGKELEASGLDAEKLREIYRTDEED